MGKFVIRNVSTGVKFDLKAANGEVIATSEVYESRAACLRGIESVRKNAANAKVQDKTAQTAVPVRNPKFELFSDRAGQYRFRLKARNGQVVAVSEGYATKAACENGMESVRKNAPEAELGEE